MSLKLSVICIMNCATFTHPSENPCLLLLILLLPQPPPVLEVLQLSHRPSPSSSCLLKMHDLLSHLLSSCIVSSSKQDKQGYEFLSIERSVTRFFHPLERRVTWFFHPLKGGLHVFSSNERRVACFSSIERRVACFFIHLPTKLLVTMNRLVLLCDHTP